MTTQPHKMIHRIGESKQLIVYIMLSRVVNPSPTLPPTLFFSVPYPIDHLCPPKF